MIADSIFHESKNVCTVRFDKVASGWKQWLMLSSDRHHDSQYCDRKKELADLTEAKDKNALIIDNGDLFDAMQGRYDPRRSYVDIRKEYSDEMITRGNDAYFDVIADEAIKFYKPFQENFLVIGRGNHDTSIVKHSSTDPLARLVYGLNTDSQHRIQLGGYGGWVRFMFTINKTKRSSIKLKYFHGAGGESPVTKGVLQTLRQAAIFPDADIVTGGHIHHAWHVPIKRENISDGAVVSSSIQHHIRTPGYNNGYGDGSGGWEVETGKVPKPMGCVFVLLEYVGDKVEITDVIQRIY